MDITSKRCTKCGVTKPLSDFRASSRYRLGVRSNCIECDRAREREYEMAHRAERAMKSKLYRKRNPDKIRAASAKWRKENPDRWKEIHAACVARHPERQKARSKKYYAEHAEECRSRAMERFFNKKDEIRVAQKIYAARKPELHREIRKRYIDRHPDIIMAARSKWRSENKGKINHYAVMRLAAKLRATPSWLSNAMVAEIESMYTARAKIEAETGIKHHVDHIIPLQGETVCGLHVPWNLQILTAAENVRKSNKLVAA